MAAVEIRGVKKRFGATPVIHGIDVQIGDGEFVVLVGPSGCGKSTLLRMIAGLEEISEGEIVIGGRVVNGVPPKERDIAMVFQNYALYPHMTVFDNMAFSLRLAKANAETIRRQVGQAAQILGLEDLLGRYPRQLSGGQRQRVAMRAEIKELHQRLKTTSVYVTHDQIEAMTMADRIVVMHDGRVEQIGTPLELYDAPRNLFVAGFIGSPAMNLLRGVHRRAGDAAWVDLEDGGRVVAPPSRAADGAQVVYGVRPEHLAPAAEGAGLQGEIAVVEPTGADTHVVVRLGATELVAVFRERHALRPGQRIHLQPDIPKTHLFDAASGTRV